MAPETLTNLSYSRRSDIWSLGVTIWEIISGLDPSQQMDLVTLAKEIRDNGFHPFIPPFIPEYLVEIMEGCWQFNPRERLSLDEILEILSEVQLLAPTGSKNGKKRNKTPAQMSKQELNVEVELVRSRTLILESEIEEILAEIEVFEQELREQRRKKKKRSKKSRKNDQSDQEDSSGRVEMEPLGFTGYVSLPVDEGTLPLSSPPEKPKRKSKHHDGLYTAIPGVELHSVMEQQQSREEVHASSAKPVTSYGSIPAHEPIGPEESSAKPTKRRDRKKNRHGDSEATSLAEALLELEQREEASPDDIDATPYISLPATESDTPGLPPATDNGKKKKKHKSRRAVNPDEESLPSENSSSGYGRLPSNSST
jgi:hypothetical protein